MKYWVNTAEVKTCLHQIMQTTFDKLYISYYLLIELPILSLWRIFTFYIS